MNALMEGLSMVGGWVARVSIQACVLIALILLIQVVMRRKLSAGWRYGLWTLLVVRLALPWAPESRFSVYNLLPSGSTEPAELLNIAPPTAGSEAAFGVDEFAPAALSDSRPLDFAPEGQGPAAGSSRLVGRFERPRDLSLSPLAVRSLSILWVIGVVFLLGAASTQSLGLSRVVMGRRAVTDQATLDLLEDCKEEMGVRGWLAVAETPRVQSPALFGFLRPTLLLPEGAVASLGPVRLRHVFLHELAHLKRGDVAVNWLMSMLQILHWFNPLVWIAFRRMRADREMACDALALSHARPGESHAYGQTIVALLEQFSQPRRLPSLAGLIEDKHQIRRRIAMISGFSKETRGWPALAVALMLILGCVALTDAPAPKTSAGGSVGIVTNATQFVGWLNNGQFDKATGAFDRKMRKAMSARALKRMFPPRFLV